MKLQNRNTNKYLIPPIMRLKHVSLLTIFCLISIALAEGHESRMTSNQRKTPYWKDVNVVQVNREKARTLLMTLDIKEKSGSIS